MKAKDFIPASKPRNFVAKNQKTGGAGAHRDKKKEQKQGYEKHKSKDVSEGSEPDEQYLDKVISDLHKDAYGMRPDREFGKEWMTSNYEEKLKIYKSMLKNLHSGVNEASDFGEPREILEDVLQTLEREVEWPLTEIMDPREVRQLLAPIIKAVNDKMMSMDEAQDDWGSMSHREFKRRELEHELGHEDDPDFERKMRQQQMDRDKGPWYIRIDGKVYKQKGEPKVFDWKKGANNYALAILKNRPELKDKILLTKNPADQ